MLCAEASLSALTVVQLKEKLRAAGLPISGRKAELVLRLAGTPPVVSADAAAPMRCCPSCDQNLRPETYRRHLAFCAPDLLDSDGWVAGDREVVLTQVSALHRSASPEFKLLHQRFGEHAITSQHELANRMGWSERRTRDTIAKLLHSIPPVADATATLRILYEDDDMIAVDKLGGVGVTPAHRWRGGSTLNQLVGHLRLTPRDAARVPKPCHRLDKETSGVLLYAKSAAAATSLMRQFEERTVNKTYAALCVARPSASEIDAEICKVDNAEQCERRVCAPGASGQSARSTLTVIGETEGSTGACLVLVKPEHGRTHQVRVHCAALGAPLVGDGLYGGEAAIQAAERASIGRHALHALSLECRHPTSGRRMSISAPLPAEMRKAATALGVQSCTATPR